MSRSAIVILLTAAVVAAVPASARRFITLNSAPWPPYFLAAEPGEAPGFAYELLEMCISEARLEARFSPLSPDAMYQALRTGALDAHIFSYSPEREAFVIFGRVPIFLDPYRAVARAGSGVQIASLQDLDPLRLGHVRRLRYPPEIQTYLDRRQQAGTSTAAESDDELLQLLVDGQIDVFVTLEAGARWAARSRGLLDRIVVIPHDFDVADYYLVVSVSSARIDDKRAFLDRIDRCLLEAQGDGRYQGLRSKYGLQ